MGIGPRIDGPKVHDLKCDAGYYEAVALGYKTAELRLNDRDFSPLDILRLHEMEFGRPTGRTIEKQITHIVWDSNGPWLAPEYCMLSLSDVPHDYDGQFARLGLHKRKHMSGVGKHKCRNDEHLRALIDRLDAEGECIAADTIAGLIWNLDLANMRYERDIGPLSRTALR